MQPGIIGLFLILCCNVAAHAQCTEAKDADMKKYKELTMTQDAQGCSQCAMLALYHCSARYCKTVEDKRKVSALINETKRNIETMGQPYCCPDLYKKAPAWGSMVGASNLGGGLGEKPGNGLNTGTTNNNLNSLDEYGNAYDQGNLTTGQMVEAAGGIISELAADMTNNLQKKVTDVKNVPTSSIGFDNKKNEGGGAGNKTPKPKSTSADEISVSDLFNNDNDDETDESGGSKSREEMLAHIQHEVFRKSDYNGVNSTQLNSIENKPNGSLSAGPNIPFDSKLTNGRIVEYQPGNIANYGVGFDNSPDKVIFTKSRYVTEASAMQLVISPKELDGWPIIYLAVLKTFWQ